MYETSRSPWKAAVLSAVTLTIYGFWWWFDVNRQLRRLGAPLHPGRSLAAVTVGWAGVVFPFRSVQETTQALAAAQRAADLPVTIRPERALRLAEIAIIGLCLFALSGLFAPAFFLFGWVPPTFGMIFVWYVQRQLNSLIESVSRRRHSGWDTERVPH